VADISIERLLEEQKRSSKVVIMEAIPDDKDHVRVIPWYRGMKCVCGRGAILPRSAIQDIRKTGETIRCCNRTLQIVEVEFSDEKLVTCEELWSAMQASRAEAMQSARRTLRKLRRTMRFVIPFVKPFPGGGAPDPVGGDVNGEGSSGIDGSDPFCVPDCISMGMKTSGGSQLRGAAWTANWQYWNSLCQAICPDD